MKVSALASLVLLFSIQAACDKGDKASSKGSSASGGGNLPTIKLVEAGKDPKQALRFVAQKGMTQTVVMSMNMGITMDMGGSPMKQQIPTIKMPMDVVVTDVDKNGDLHYKFELKDTEIVTDASTNPAVVDGMKTALDGMKGLAGSAVVTSRGFTKDVDIKIPPGASAQMTQFLDSFKQSIGQMSAPMPEEPVGVGAKWQTTTTIQQNGVKMNQVANTELIAIDGNVIKLAVNLSQTAPRQKITNNGMTVELQSMNGSGKGETMFKLDQIVPKLANVTLSSDMKLKAGEQTMGMSFDVAMTMESQ